MLILCMNLLMMQASDGALELTLDQIAANHEKALGGREALAGIKSLRYSGRYQFRGSDHAFGVVYREAQNRCPSSAIRAWCRKPACLPWPVWPD